MWFLATFDFQCIIFVMIHPPPQKKQNITTWLPNRWSCKIITHLNLKCHSVPVTFAELKAQRLTGNDKQPSVYPSPRAYSLTANWKSFKEESLSFWKKPLALRLSLVSLLRGYNSSWIRFHHMQSSHSFGGKKKLSLLSFLLDWREIPQREKCIRCGLVLKPQQWMC